jgi:glycosyltransferase involved in cell wall biosynthesis
MKVLVITGDTSFKPGNPRYELQKNAVETFEVVFLGRGSIWPKIPTGEFDVVTVQDPFWRGLFALRVAKKLKATLNVQVHTDLDAQRLVKRILAHLVLRNADSIRVVTEKIKSQVTRMGVQAPVRVLPVFIDLSRFRSVVPRPHAQKTILWVGRFEPEKDPMRAIKIFEQVHAQVPDVKLVMLGKGSLEKTIRKKAHKLPVEFPGWQDPTSYLAESDVVLSTSRHESFGVSIVEALAAGVPVVAPEVGVAREAGASIAANHETVSKVIEAMNNHQRGELKLTLPSAFEWAKMWKKTLQA